MPASPHATGVPPRPRSSRQLAWASNPQLLGRLAWGGLTGVLLFLAGFSGFIAVSSHAAADRVRQSSGERNAYEAARFDVATEESLERKYRLQPSREVRALHAAAANSLVTHLAVAATLADDASDQPVIDEMLANHTGYLVEVTRMFDAVDQGNTALVDEIDIQDADPLFNAIDESVNATADAFDLEATHDLATLNQLEDTVLTTTPVVSLIGFLALGVFWVVLGTFQRRLDQSAARFRSVVQNASDVVTIVRADGRVEYASPAATQLWALDPEALRGTNVQDLVHPDDLSAARAHMTEALNQPGSNIESEIRLQHGDGSWRDCRVVANNLLQQPSVAGVVVTFSDITERKEFERQLKFLAFHDALTRLPNRALFTDRLERALAHADRDFHSLGVLFLDIDNFKVVNDSLGHQQGDALLAEVAAQIRSCVRAEDTVARLGGDEFTVLLEEVSTEAEAIDVAQRVVGALSRPILLGGREVFVTASIGVALSVPRHESPDTLLRNADLAMYRAKRDGKDRIAIFDRSMEVHALERMEVETELRMALDRGEFEVHYQPIYSLADQRITGFEALVRWRKPDGRLVLPMTFIPIAEETGLIVRLGQWVLDQACEQTRRWQMRHPANPPLSISVNLSARQFQNPYLTQDVEGTLRRTGLDPSSLKLEVTESVAMQDPEASAIILRGLKTIGLRLAIDDFGTGHSSLSYLQRFPVDTLKIDRSFVDGLGINTQNEAIVQSVIALARALNLSTTGEGIETATQQERLRALGCDAGQGFLFARPAPAEEIERLLGSDPELASAA